MDRNTMIVWIVLFAAIAIVAISNDYFKHKTESPTTAPSVEKP